MPMPRTRTNCYLASCRYRLPCMGEFTQGREVFRTRAAQDILKSQIAMPKSLLLPAYFAPFLTVGFPLLLGMTLNALEHRDVAEIHGVLEGLVCFVAELALVIRERAEIDRVLEWSGLH